MMAGEMNLSRAAIEFGGTLMYPDCRFDSVSTDTRRLSEGQLFVALRGDHFNAHDFLQQAAKNACGLVVDHPDRALEITQWVVPDTTIALGQIARLNRQHFNGKLLALTGSAGKTTVKEMLAAILAKCGKTAATKGNLNNQVGVPLTLLELSTEHQYAVIEMGASTRGEIAYLSDIAEPDIALITNVLPAHVEGFGSVDAIADAKGEIYAGLKADGIAVLGLDSNYVERWRELIGNRSCITWSLANSKADVRATGISADDLGRCKFSMITPQGDFQVRLDISGRHNVANALAAASAALAAGAEPEAIAAGLAVVTPTSGRMDLQMSIGGGYLVDDTYNANPGSAQVAIDALVALPGKTILVLGDMGELGADEVNLHREVGAYAAGKGVNALYTTGRLSCYASEAFGDNARHFDNKSELVDALKPLIGEGVSVLVKGSRSARMEDVVKALVSTGPRAHKSDVKAFETGE